jgi:hypothetical protein
VYLLVSSDALRQLRRAFCLLAKEHSQQYLNHHTKGNDHLTKADNVIAIDTRKAPTSTPNNGQEVMIRIPQKVQDPSLPGMVLYKYFRDNPAAAPLDSLDCLLYLLDDISEADPDMKGAVDFMQHLVMQSICIEEPKQKQRRKSK